MFSDPFNGLYIHTGAGSRLVSTVGVKIPTPSVGAETLR